MAEAVLLIAGLAIMWKSLDWLGDHPEVYWPIIGIGTTVAGYFIFAR